MENEDMADKLECIQQICNNILECTNQYSFAKMDDQQVYSLMRLRELSHRAVIGQDTRVTENDLTSTLRFYINRMGSRCKAILDVVVVISDDGLDGKQMQLLQKLKELLCGIIKDAKMEPSIPDEYVDPWILEFPEVEEEATYTMSEDVRFQVEQSMLDLIVQEEDLEVGDMLIRNNNNQISHILNSVTWPENGSITLEWVLDLTHILEQSSWKTSPSEFQLVMPFYVVNKLLDTVASVLHKEPNCVEINCHEDGSKVVVVGDIHGQYHDLLHLFELANYPSENQFYVFNGDYVDRGAWGLEVFLVLSAWKVLKPDRVFILRGSHESGHCTSAYGFEKEVRAKVGEQGKQVYNKCLETFKELPLASIVAGKVYITHGGLFRKRSSTPSQIPKRKKTRNLEVGSLDDLFEIERYLVDAPTSDDDPNILLSDVLWSDPSIKDGLRRNRDQAVGLKWGPDCTEAFLKQSKLKVIIRSHEGPDERDGQDILGDMLSGYCTDHDGESGKLFTLFSAPDYPQFSKKRYNNEGAYAVLEPPNFENPSFCSFEAVDRPKIDAYFSDEDDESTSGDQDLPLTDEQAPSFSRSSTEESNPPRLNPEVNFAALGIENPPPWSITLTDDEDGPQVIKIPRSSEVEGLPLPPNLEEPHKAAYEYFLELIAGLKLLLQNRVS